MTNLCKAFLMDDPVEVHEHIHRNWEVVRQYGDRAYGNWLYTWDDGYRVLGRCRECRAYILLQQSEYHGMEDDDYYTDYFPVADAAEADELNRKYDGFAIENKFPRRHLLQTNHRFAWSGHPKDSLPDSMESAE